MKLMFQGQDVIGIEMTHWFLSKVVPLATTHPAFSPLGTASLTDDPMAVFVQLTKRPELYPAHTR